MFVFTVVCIVILCVFIYGLIGELVIRYNEAGPLGPCPEALRWLAICICPFLLPI